MDGVRELAENYDLDGIHFDDYFYPSPDESFDSTAYREYKMAGDLCRWATGGARMSIF